MKGTFSVKSVDKGWAKIVKMARQIKQRKNYAKAGVLGNDGAVEVKGKPPTPGRSGEGVSNIELAAIHEFGAPGAGIPERSFIRSSFEAHRPEYIALLAKLLPKVIENKMQLNQALGLVGARMAADMKNGITTGAGIPPPLEDATVAAKGSSRPLVDTGQLVNSITWAVAKGE